MNYPEDDIFVCRVCRNMKMRPLGFFNYKEYRSHLKHIHHIDALIDLIIDTTRPYSLALEENKKVYDDYRKRYFNE